MEVKAHLHHLHMSPRKVRRVAQLVSGLAVPRAEAELLARLELAATPLLKLLQSAIANARQVSEARLEDMKVRSCIVNSGPVMKRFRPRSRGMAHPYAKRMSHISLVLEIPDVSRRERRTATSLKPQTVQSNDDEERSKEEKSRTPSLASRRFEQKKTPKLPMFGRRIFQRKSV